VPSLALHDYATINDEGRVMPYLIVNTFANGLRLHCFVADINIGRHPSNDIVLTSVDQHTISRNHAEIRCENEKYLLVDRSLNGTRINGELINEHLLSHGDQVEIGDFALTFIDDVNMQPASKHGLSRNVQPASMDWNEKTKKVLNCTAINDGLADVQLKEQLRDNQIIVEDERMMAVYRDVYSVSRINVPILILGEPGTGKEKVAQAIHKFSKASGDFVALNCSAIPENLFESELFGSMKGAFSDAQNTIGKLELADNGTLFLDEIGEMEKSCQPKLLRFLESRSISRLGETRIRDLNIQIVAATNQDLKEMIQRDAFRADLFQRLACVRLNIPPLRTRKRDILPLAEFFLDNYCRKYNLKPLEISPQASQIMLAYHWPGNVRELANIMLNVCVRTRTQGRKIMPAHLTSASEEIGEFDVSVDGDFVPLKSMEKNHILKALKKAGNNKSKASAMLGITRATLYKKIQKYNIG
jgi:transcriptional regulator with PAS, ATPase and Fis domain